MSTDLIPSEGAGLAYLIPAWLDASAGRTGSRETAHKYAATMRDFCHELQRAGLALESEPAHVATVAQAFAGRRQQDGSRDVAAATYNQRLAILSSFYRFARLRGVDMSTNPMERVQRRPVQPYAGAHALDPDDALSRLAAIDRGTLAGLRDFALLSLGLTTGRRREELRTLTWQQCERHGADRGELTITWHTKGNKVLRDTLAPGTARALLRWCASFYGDLEQLAPAAPVFVTLHRGYRGRMLSSRAISLVCERWLGTSKVHATRHSFAALMEQSGARVSEIQARLGHASIQTTGRYLQALASDRNPYAPALEQRLGIS